VSLYQGLAILLTLLHDALIPGYLGLRADTAGLQLLPIRANWIVSCFVHLLRHYKDQSSEIIFSGVLGVKNFKCSKLSFNKMKKFKYNFNSNEYNYDLLKLGSMFMAEMTVDHLHHL